MVQCALNSSGATMTRETNDDNGYVAHVHTKLGVVAASCGLVSRDTGAYSANVA